MSSLAKVLVKVRAGSTGRLRRLEYEELCEERSILARLHRQAHGSDNCLVLLFQLFSPPARGGEEEARSEDILVDGASGSEPTQSGIGESVRRRWACALLQW
jgi:hypothetical protein